MKLKVVCGVLKSFRIILVRIFMKIKYGRKLKSTLKPLYKLFKIKLTTEKIALNFMAMILWWTKILEFG
jgi:hypothetical protein